MYPERRLVINSELSSRRRGDREMRHTVFLHDSEEFDDNLRDWLDENLSLSSSLSVDDIFKRIG